jgi:predicted aspartyl protease
VTTFSVPVQIGDLAATHFETIEAVVDRASTFTAVPGDILRRLGIQPARRQSFRLASGDVVESDVGDARVRVAGLEGVTPVIFNGPGEPNLLGAVTLEALVLGVDQVAQRLIPVEGLRVSRLDPR